MISEELMIEQNYWHSKEVLADVQSCDGTCRQHPFCPEHGSVRSYDGLEAGHLFLFVNRILVGELDGSTSPHGADGVLLADGSRGPVTVQGGDIIELHSFYGPWVDYETWQDA